jgi:pimeloyl-ACP methyl ester carboxylesterase
MRFSVPWKTWVGMILVVVAGVGVQAGRMASPEAPAISGVTAEQASADARVVPFTIRVPDAVLADLKQRLINARFPDELEGVGWSYGTNLAYMRELVTYWRDTFDWREQERRLNRFEQFKTNIDGLDIHFIHRRAKQPQAFPLIITHGWPGSFAEFAKIIEPLTDPGSHGGRPEDAFDLVVPSIPGYGFSDKPRQPGYHSERIAGILVKLMARLGYTRYGTQGGDIGAGISAQIAIQDPAHVAGLHLNFCGGGPPPGVADPTAGVPPEQLARRRQLPAEETGYSHLQGTKPQTLGFALNDSPIGLAAWIVEKYRAWSIDPDDRTSQTSGDPNGDLARRFTKDELLTNITLYWVTQTPTSAARFYYEGRHRPRRERQRVTVPTACAQFPREAVFTPVRWLEARYNLVRWTEMPRGGHFAALEEPELLVDDIRAFFRDLRVPASR